MVQATEYKQKLDRIRNNAESSAKDFKIALVEIKKTHAVSRKQRI